MRGRDGPVIVIGLKQYGVPWGTARRDVLKRIAWRVAFVDKRYYTVKSRELGQYAEITALPQDLWPLRK